MFIEVRVAVLEQKIKTVLKPAGPAAETDR